MNASWSADFTRVYSNVDVSVAVQTPLGLMVPIVRDADKKGLASISGDVKALAAKVGSTAVFWISHFELLLETLSWI